MSSETYFSALFSCNSESFWTTKSGRHTVYCIEKKNWDQTVKLSSADQISTKILPLCCLSLPSNIFRNIFAYHLIVIQHLFVTSRPQSCQANEFASVVYQPECRLVQCGAVHTGRFFFFFFLPLGQKEMPQSFSSVFSGHIAPISKVFASLYCIDSLV